METIAKSKRVALPNCCLKRRAESMKEGCAFRQYSDGQERLNPFNQRRAGDDDGLVSGDTEVSLNALALQTFNFDQTGPDLIAAYLL